MMNFNSLIMIVISFIILSSNVVFADVKNCENVEFFCNTENMIVDINIAVISNSNTPFSTVPPLIEDFNNYQWMGGNKLYRFNSFFITKNDILQGRLTTDKYDLLIIPASDGEYLAKNLFLKPVKLILWKKNIGDFIKSGGGYVGYCYGSYIMGKIDGKPKNLVERVIKASNVGLSNAKIENVNSHSPFLPHIINDPVGIAAYVYFSDNNMSKDIRFCGVPIDIKINKNNPIFDDFVGVTRRMRWIGGGILEVPNAKSSSNLTVLGYYPDLNISKNSSTDIYEWKYTGGLKGFLKGFQKARVNGFNFIDSLSWIHYMATDWECTGKIIETHNAGKPIMTMETYPNENKARIILSTGHPEFKVWWGGEIINAKETKTNKLWDGLHYWTNISSYSEQYNHCLVRRHVAWVSKKVPDNDLPPVYGPSQACDIYPYNQTSSQITIFGNSELSDGIISLDLYYRYSEDNSTWNNWTFYESDIDISDGWSWYFEASNGMGYYEFYSIRLVEYNQTEEFEKPPTAADAKAYFLN